MAEYSEEQIHEILEQFLDHSVEVLRSAIEESTEIPTNLSDQLVGFLEHWINLKILPFPSAKFRTQLLKGVCSLGNKPLEERNLDQLVKRWGFPVHGKNLSSSVLILGQNMDAYPKQINLEELIDQRNTEAKGELRIYSQEMFLFSVFSGKDIYESDGGISLKNHILKHPFLKSVENEYFAWPDTFAMPGSKHNIKIDTTQDGLLAMFGYRVGMNRLRTDERRYKLKTLYEYDLSTLRGQIDNNYLYEWAGVRSSGRLKKMAITIATLTKNAKRSHMNGQRNMSVAISEWESDLAWLKSTYYDGRYNHRGRWYWPTT